LTLGFFGIFEAMVIRFEEEVPMRVLGIWEGDMTLLWEQEWSEAGGFVV
jgi:hypothetical protein